MLLSGAQESSVNYRKNGFVQNAKISLTRILKTCKKLYGSVPILQKGTTEDTQELKLFKRYLDDIMCTVKVNHLDCFDKAYSLHQNLQFTLEVSTGN